jgi:hypothetical protein
VPAVDVTIVRNDDPPPWADLADTDLDHLTGDTLIRLDTPLDPRPR